jgi:curved DNA-binding protein CbpA
MLYETLFDICVATGLFHVSRREPLCVLNKHPYPRHDKTITHKLPSGNSDTPKIFYQQSRIILSMSIVTHYTTLGLLPTAAPEIIRAAYKALALLYHPDKTIHLAARERASHAAAFKEVQAAYDVLSSLALKESYDARLRHRAEVVDNSRLTSRNRSSTPKQSQTIKLTTPDEKTAMRTEARQALEDLRSKRVQRDEQDAQLDIADLKDMIQTWQQLAMENEFDPALRAHCVIRIHEYEQKIAEREQQHEQWLMKTSAAKQKSSIPTKRYCTGPDAPIKQFRSTSIASTPAVSAFRSRVPRTSPAASSPTPQSRIGRDAQRKREAAERAAATAARTEARILEKAQRETARQALIDQKASAVRAEKEKQKAKVKLQAKQEAERMTKARAKAGAAPLGTIGAVVDNQLDDESSSYTSFGKHVATTARQTKAQKLCSMCGSVHESFREWRVCNTQAAAFSENPQGAFLRAV